MMKDIKKLVETSIGLFTFGVISIVLGFSLSSKYSAENVNVADRVNPQYGFVGFGALLILISIVLLIIVMDNLQKKTRKTSKHDK